MLSNFSLNLVTKHYSEELMDDKKLGSGACSFGIMSCISGWATMPCFYTKPTLMPVSLYITELPLIFN